MKNEDKITLSEWNELTSEEKEILRTWAVKHGFELDLVPNSSGTFDPTCDYAALLTHDQMIEYLQECNQKIPDSNNTEGDYEVLWKSIIILLKQKNN